MPLPRGIDVRQSGLGALVRVGIDDNTGVALGTGTASLSLCEYQADGSVGKQLDFADNTFKAVGLTTPTLALTHRPTPAGLVTGIWTVFLTTTQCANMSIGGLYVALVTHSALPGVVVRREWQYGSVEGDIAAIPDPLAAPVPGAYGAGTAGKLLGNLDAPVSTRSTYAGGAVATVTDKAGYGLTPAERTSIAAAVGNDVTDAIGATVTTTATNVAAIMADYQKRTAPVLLPPIPPAGYGPGVDFTIPAGTVAPGSGGPYRPSIVVNGLPAGFNWLGQRLEHLASGESRRVGTQSYASGSYTFGFTGAQGTTDGPFSSLAEGDYLAPTP
jgi:hypothetical protein